MIKIFEAFAGYGSQALALRYEGITHEVVGISEIDKYAIQAYRQIHGDVKNFGDITKIDVETLPDMDLFTYSSPFQDLSVANNKGKGLDGSRSGLLYECEKIIRAKKPKYLLFENVAAILNKKHCEKFNEWLKVLNEMGYHNVIMQLNAKNFGVPQNRERVFVVSTLEPIKLKSLRYVPPGCISDILEDEVDDKYLLSDKVQVRFKAEGVTEHIAGTTKPDFRTIGQRDLVYKPEGIMGCLVATDYKQPKQIRVGVVNKGGQGDRIYSTQGLSVSLCANSGGNGSNTGLYAVEQKVRKLTPRECFRLMGVRDEDYDKLSDISDTQLYKLAGNSIVTNVLQSIFSSIF